MFTGLEFEPTDLPAAAEALRTEVRAFVASELPEDYWPNSDAVWDFVVDAG